MLGVSLAIAHAAAASSCELPLFRYLGGTNAARTLPVPMMNILNGGKHADNNVDFQEFMIHAAGRSSTFSRRPCACRRRKCFTHLKKVLHKTGKLNTAVGDEGGFAPNVKSSDEDALEVIGEGGRVRLATSSASRSSSPWMRPATELYDEAKKKGKPGYKLLQECPRPDHVSSDEP